VGEPPLPGEVPGDRSAWRVGQLGDGLGVTWAAAVLVAFGHSTGVGVLALRPMTRTLPITAAHAPSRAASSTAVRREPPPVGRDAAGASVDDNSIEEFGRAVATDRSGNGSEGTTVVPSSFSRNGRYTSNAAARAKARSVVAGWEILTFGLANP
jgi:hypothetical protein